MLRITVFTLVAAALSASLMFNLKYEVAVLESDLRAVNGEILRNQEDIHVLKAEWSHLNNPARLKKLVARHLEMAPLHPVQVVSYADLPPYQPMATVEQVEVKP
ncbi:MAG: cell division protein FtsL [Magnetospiraceae bacterium]